MDERGYLEGTRGTMAVETMEPADRQGVRIEEIVVVRENGVENLSQWPIEEFTRIED